MKKPPSLKFKNRPDRKQSQIRQFAQKLDQAGLQTVLESFPTESQRNIALDLLRPHLRFEPSCR